MERSLWDWRQAKKGLLGFNMQRASEIPHVLNLKISDLSKNRSGFTKNYHPVDTRRSL